jgi:AcrR family transcriptional regulator
MVTAVEAKTRDDYFEVGLRLMGEGGTGAVTIARLCEALDVTKGSFYHHFRTIDDYRLQLLKHWAVEREGQIAEALERADGPLHRIVAMREHALGLAHEAEAAIRSWSRRDPDVDALQQRVDVERERAITEAYGEAGVPAEVATLLGRIAVGLMIGVQHRSRPADREGLAAMYRLLHDMVVAQYLGGVTDARPSGP